MKKLNRKGFTLVELLAVIIILAIVVGITIPAVLTTTNKTKQKAGITAAQTVASWVDSEYNIIVTGLGEAGLATLDSNFTNTNACGDNAANCTAANGKDITLADFITSAGLTQTNVTSINVKINTSTGRSCVTLTIPTTSDYYWANVDTNNCGNNCYSSTTTIKGGSC